MGRASRCENVPFIPTHRGDSPHRFVNQNQTSDRRIEPVPPLAISLLTLLLVIVMVVTTSGVGFPPSRSLYRDQERYCQEDCPGRGRVATSSPGGHPADLR